MCDTLETVFPPKYALPAGEGASFVKLAKRYIAFSVLIGECSYFDPDGDFSRN